LNTPSSASLIKTYKLYWVDAPARTPSSKQTKEKATEEEEIEYDDEDSSAKSSSGKDESQQ